VLVHVRNVLEGIVKGSLCLTHDSGYIEVKRLKSGIRLERAAQGGLIFITSQSLTWYGDKGLDRAGGG